MTQFQIDGKFFLMIRKNFFILVPLCFLLAVSCSKMFPRKDVMIGIDATFFSSPVGNKQGAVYAFTMELFEEILNPTKYNPIYQELSFDNTLQSIDNHSCDIAVTSLPILFETKRLYDFSSVFLSLGDVFVTRRAEGATSFQSYEGRIIAITRNPEIVTLFSNYPGVDLTYYTYIPDTLEQIANLSVDGAIIPYLTLSSNLSEEYRRLLSISPKKLTTTGLRVISLKGKNNALIRTFNKRLASVIDDGTFTRLLEKWNLTL